MKKKVRLLGKGEILVKGKKIPVLAFPDPKDLTEGEAEDLGKLILSSIENLGLLPKEEEAKKKERERKEKEVVEKAITEYLLSLLNKKDLRKDLLRRSAKLAASWKKEGLFPSARIEDLRMYTFDWLFLLPVSEKVTYNRKERKWVSVSK